MFICSKVISDSKVTLFLDIVTERLAAYHADYKDVIYVKIDGSYIMRYRTYIELNIYRADQCGSPTLLQNGRTQDKLCYSFGFKIIFKDSAKIY
jgi:hypothetical protein